MEPSLKMGFIVDMTRDFGIIVGVVPSQNRLWYKAKMQGDI